MLDDFERQNLKILGSKNIFKKTLVNIGIW
ncbi:Protein CBG26304 [Caenorhabditis briggsae]|uniref:Protein CBG26304 n=1 Tax=Caenorhabditis briggsae TaxID=6238 RepID=B6IG77_CAEBR|nr:Protein CBG26304 [Caenorhabditis briggsae]CAR98907.1 Protein CBG26304 [Caenorhabditis briggsae]